jgi:hypothetical protein
MYMLPDNHRIAVSTTLLDAVLANATEWCAKRLKRS